MQVDLGRALLGEPKPAAVVLQRVVRMDSALHADLRRAEVDRFLHTGGEVVLAHQVGIRGALALAETAERAADDADVGEVDVPIDDEGGGLPRKLGAQLVRRGPHLFDYLWAGLREEPRQPLLAELLAAAALLYRLGRHLRCGRRLLPSPGAPSRDEAPVLQLHHVEDALLHPLRVEV